MVKSQVMQIRRTKIVATIGPASSSPVVVERLIEAGMDVARFNFSHGTLEEQRERILTVQRLAAATGRHVATMADLRGPEIRIGTFPGGAVTLRAGQEFVLTTRPGRGDDGGVSVTYPGLPGDVRPGQIILLDDGNFALRVLSVSDEDVSCRVENGGVLKDRKKVNLPGVDVHLPAVTEADRRAIALAAELGMDFIALSFVRSREDVLVARELVQQAGGRQALVAKIECRLGVEHFEEILAASDAVMVARGDMGVELPAEEVPILQKSIIRRAREAGKPVITATQMLESMVHEPRPTRAEASDVANAIFDGTDAVMLSAETASGEYPVEAVQTMDRIARRVEEALEYERYLEQNQATGDVTDAVSRAACVVAGSLGAAAILTPTSSGYTSRMVARHRPRQPVVGCTPSAAVARQLALVFGVVPVVVAHGANSDEQMRNAVAAARAAGIVAPGDRVVITAGVIGTPGTTDLIKVATVPAS